jgi:uncharacterized membrane protein YidH (DUF202 family)
MAAIHFGAFFLIVGILLGLYALSGVFQLEVKIKKESTQTAKTIIFLLCLSLVFLASAIGTFIFSGIIE